jgi:hypothetical protein
MRQLSIVPGSSNSTHHLTEEIVKSASVTKSSADSVINPVLSTEEIPPLGHGIGACEYSRVPDGIPSVDLDPLYFESPSDCGASNICDEAINAAHKNNVKNVSFFMSKIFF